MSQIVQDAHRSSQYYLDIITVAGYFLFSTALLCMLLNEFPQELTFLSANQAMGVMLSSPYYWVFSALYLSVWVVLRFRLKAGLYKQLKYLKKMEDWSSFKHDIYIEDSVNTEHSIDKTIENIQSKQHKGSQNEISFEHVKLDSSLHDKDTGIGNRDFFNHRLEELLKEERAYGGVFFIQFKSLEYLDIQYGHQEVLDLLNRYVVEIKENTKSFPGYLISRRSEDEISILLPRIRISAFKKLAHTLVDKLLQVPTPIGVDTEEFIHIGGSYFKEGMSAYDIKSEADMALRSAQLQGPSQWFMFNNEDVESEAVKGALRWREFLLKMIEQKSFIIFFQPVLSSKNHHILHQEALCKIKVEAEKFLSAKVFIPMAEKCGLTLEIDLLILEQVCHTLNYENNHNDNFSVNLSVESLLTTSFMDDFFHKLSHYSGIAQRLIIEITEYHLSHHLESLLPVLAKLHEFGVRILVDKVGQYVVSAHYLKLSCVSYVKLHKSIVFNIDVNHNNQVFIKKFLKLCTPLDIQVYALGVEKNKEWDKLLSLGIHGGQGHFLAKPICLPFVAKSELQKQEC